MNPQPSTLATLSNEQRERFEAFARLLIEENRRLNLTSINTPEEIRLRHFEDALTALPYLRDFAANARLTERPALVDIGSGAGLPGLALAIALPEWSITSIEATGKKTRFQERVIKELDLDNARVVQERAEILALQKDFRERFDIATARAVASLAALAELTLPFARVGGRVLAWKGPRLEEEREAARVACAKLGGAIDAEIPYSLPETEKATEENPDTETRFRLVALAKTEPCPAHYPREYKSIKKRPLGGR